MTGSKTSEVQMPEFTFEALQRSLRKYAPYIIGASLLSATAVYFWQKSRPAVYESFASLVATAANNDYDRLGNRTPALPEAVVREALRGPEVINSIILSINGNPKLNVAEKNAIVTRLTQEFRSRQLAMLKLSSQLDYAGVSGLYMITVEAPTANSAAVLADTATDALMKWDIRRATGNLIQARDSLRAQVKNLQQQVQQAPAPERDVVLANLNAARQQLSQAEVMASGIRGSFAPVASAVVPDRATAPRPLRSAVIAALLTSILGLLAAFLATLSDRTLHSEEDLLTFDVPTLGTLPRMSRRDVLLNGFIRTSREAGLYEAIGFLRINLMERLGSQPGRCILITSTLPGEGKSSISAALADSMASTGQRVLVLDADMRRGTQQSIWSKSDTQSQTIAIAGAGTARNLQEAIRQPDNFSVTRVREGLDVLPGGSGIHDTLGMLGDPALGELIQRFRQVYDLIIIDSPPLLVLSDSLVLAKQTDGMIIMTEANKTSIQNIRRVIRRAANTNINVLGFVINKAPRQDSSSYYYYAPKSSVGK